MGKGLFNVVGLAIEMGCLKITWSLFKIDSLMIGPWKKEHFLLKSGYAIKHL